MQSLQDVNHSNVDNLNSVRREVSSHFRDKKEGCLKAQIDETKTNNYFKNIRGLYGDISDFKVYQLITNVVKDENGDWITDFQSI
jgi:hypothetical protein